MHFDWKHLAINAAFTLLLVGLAVNGVLSPLPGMPKKSLV